MQFYNSILENVKKSQRKKALKLECVKIIQNILPITVASTLTTNRVVIKASKHATTLKSRTILMLISFQMQKTKQKISTFIAYTIAFKLTKIITKDILFFCTKHIHTHTYSLNYTHKYSHTQLTSGCFKTNKRDVVASPLSHHFHCLGFRFGFCCSAWCLMSFSEVLFEISNKKDKL